jgi:hypothetical protein
MTPRKRELLDVLRQRKDREAGIDLPTSRQSFSVPAGRSFAFHLPPRMLQIGAGVVAVALVIWGLYAMFGGPQKVSYGILASRYEISRMEQGQKDGSALLKLEYDAVNLLRVSDDSGQEQLALFVGRETDPATLEDTLQRIQETSPEGSAGNFPFRGASIEPRPDSSN